MLVCVKYLVTQSCPTLCDPMDCSPPGSSVHKISQARILERVPLPPPGDPPNLGIELGSPTLQAVSLPPESPGKTSKVLVIGKERTLKRIGRLDNFTGLKKKCIIFSSLKNKHCDKLRKCLSYE